MSSTLLYLAIVAVWAVVLVPMWLRRDTDTPAFSRLLHKRAPHGEPHTEELTLEEPTLDDVHTPLEPPAAPAYEEPFEAPPAPPATRRGGGSTRGTVIARRRRRTFGLSLVLVLSVAAVLTGLAPWWTTVPAAGLLTGHLALLRVAVGMDAAAQAAATRRRTVELRARQAAEEAHQAEIIDFVARTHEVFDQYADDRRAVGD